MKKLAKKVKQKKKGLFNSGLVKLAGVALVIGCAAVVITTGKDCADKEKELAEVQEKINGYETENTELQRVLDSDDMSAYMEKVAIEERGYAYPDERRFYDTSRD